MRLRRCWEWKKVQFKADQKDRKNLIMRRMTGAIEDVMREVRDRSETQ